MLTTNSKIIAYIVIAVIAMALGIVLTMLGFHIRNNRKDKEDSSK